MPNAVAEKTFVTILPHDVISDNIFCYLDYKSLCKVSQTCEGLRSCAYAERHWRILCKRHWLDERQERSHQSWRENFIKWFQDMGRYINIYPEVKTLWNRILNSLKMRAPKVYTTLHEAPHLVDMVNFETHNIVGATEQNLKELEKILSKELPDEVRCSYRICNGQKISDEHLERHKYGLLGVFSVYHYTLCEVLLPVQTILSNVIANKQNKCLDFTSRVIFVAGNTKGQSGFSRRVCLVPSGEVRAGSVCIQVDEGENVPGAAFVYADNFTGWLRTVATSLESPELIVDKDGSLLQFRKEPDCEAETYEVKVSVATVLVPEFSSLTRTSPRLMFAYRITMSMDEDKNPHHECTLETHQREIVEYVSETNQRSQKVDGPPVQGQNPTIGPGHTYSYSSWTPLTTQQGFMQGHFKFRNCRRENIEYEVVCPRFHLRCPEVKNFTFE